MKIKLLSSTTINKIAAGEVIERPSSVVKELLENAIDAGADKVYIRLDQAGKNLIEITDNGSGMSKEELEMAVMRHATSKLDESDLTDIRSFGFRGEALPSIGAISKLKITTIKAGADIGHSITILGGNQLDTKEAVLQRGTKIEVRDLFFATPARLKFLRSDNTEFAAITNIVKRISLAHPDIEIKLSHNDKERLNLKAKSQKERVNDVMGEDFRANGADVSFSQNDMEITGRTSLPTYNRANSEEQFLFVNNRPVKDKVLNVAVKLAYQDFLATGRHPVCAIFIKMPPAEVDVNVHPAKTEVRFVSSQLVRSCLMSAIKSALSGTSNRVSDTNATKALGMFRQGYNNEYSTKPAADFARSSLPKNDMIKTFGMVAEDAARNANIGSPSGQTDFKFQLPPSAPSSSSHEDYIARMVTDMPQMPSAGSEGVAVAVREEDFPMGGAKAQLHGTYIISQTQDSIIIVDQHAAHERLGYEKIKKYLESNELIKQRLLVPEVIELADTERAQKLTEYQKQMSDFGIDFERFGDKSIIVTTSPSILGEINLTKLINDVVDNIVVEEEIIALPKLIEHVTETYACHYAIRAGRKMNMPEMNELLRQMETTPFSGQCNHGRPTYVELKKTDIEKLFGRR